MRMTKYPTVLPALVLAASARFELSAVRAGAIAASVIERAFSQNLVGWQSRVKSHGSRTDFHCCGDFFLAASVEQQREDFERPACAYGRSFRWALNSCNCCRCDSARPTTATCQSSRI